MGGVGGCTHGGVDEHLRVPLRDTQEVSITLTPMLQVRTQMHSWSKLRDSKAEGWGGRGLFCVLEVVWAELKARGFPTRRRTRGKALNPDLISSHERHSGSGWRWKS